MQREISDLKYNLRCLQLGAYAFSALLLLSPGISRVDESGISFWLPGQVDSLPAVPAAGQRVETFVFHWGSPEHALECHSKCILRGDRAASLEVWRRGIVGVYANSADLSCRLNDITLLAGSISVRAHILAVSA
jgi:hypothetical protein